MRILIYIIILAMTSSFSFESKGSDETCSGDYTVETFQIMHIDNPSYDLTKDSFSLEIDNLDLTTVQRSGTKVCTYPLKVTNETQRNVYCKICTHTPAGIRSRIKGGTFNFDVTSAELLEAPGSDIRDWEYISLKFHAKYDHSLYEMSCNSGIFKSSEASRKHHLKKFNMGAIYSGISKAYGCIKKMSVKGYTPRDEANGNKGMAQ